MGLIGLRTGIGEFWAVSKMLSSHKMEGLSKISCLKYFFTFSMELLQRKSFFENLPRNGQAEISAQKRAGQINQWAHHF